MPYLSNFQYDIFLSYAHLDNQPEETTEEGWVTKFCQYFQLQLNRYLDGSNTAHIWFDHDLRKNEMFDERIKKGIENSGVLLAFTSNRYYASEYCKKERELFYATAKAASLGIDVNDKRRIFNIQQLNSPYQQWPSEFQGGLAYNMFKYSNQNSPNRNDDPGITLDPESEREEFRKVMFEIVRDVSDTLKAIKNKLQAPDPVASVKTRVFFGKVAYTLAPMKTQIINELAAINIIADKEINPLPQNKTEHEQVIVNKLKESALSLHLFDGIGGDPIAEDYPYSFSQEQFFIGEKMKKDQLVFVPQELDFSILPDVRHGKFLSELLTNKTTDSKYNLIREFSIPQIIDHIKEKIIKPVDLKHCEDATLLDYNETDIITAVKYFSDLQITNKNIRLAPPGNGPSDAIEKYWQLLNEVSTVIIVCVTVAKDWLRERIKQIICAIRTGKIRVSKLQLYSENGIEDVNIDQLNKLF